MNIKLHTPKTLKNGSGMGSMKQFMLSLLATTVSIVLTFGTAAIIDNNKKQKEKREIVMMVMYDMYNSLKEIEYNDSTILMAMDIQLQLAKDTTRYDELWSELSMSIPSVEYTETVEHIFSSSIETINTVGNVLFTENVASFYFIRQQYKTMVGDSLLNEIMVKDPFSSLKGALTFRFETYAIASSGLKLTMQNLFARCKQMMDVSDEDLQAYLEERKQMEQSVNSSQDERFSTVVKLKQLQKDIDSTRYQLNLK